MKIFNVTQNEADIELDNLIKKSKECDKFLTEMQPFYEPEKEKKSSKSPTPKQKETKATK
jgi:hypothetical protein